MTMSARLFGALVIVALLGSVPSGGQAKGDEPGLRVVMKDGEPVWRVSEGGKVTLGELIKHYADARNVYFIYAPKRVSGDVTIERGQKAELRGTEIDVFVASSFQEFRLCIIEKDERLRVVMPVIHAVGFAPMIPAGEIASQNPGRWVTAVYKFEHSDSHDAFLSFREKPDGTRVLGSPMFQLRTATLTGPAIQVKRDLALVRELDLAGKTVIRGFDIPDGVDVPDAVSAVTTLLTGRSPTPTVTAVPSTRRLLVRAGEKDMDAVAEAVAAMK
jgi:hypothetical protein